MNLKIADLVSRYAKWVLTVIVLLTLIPLYFAAKGLSVNVVLEEMLPANAPNVELYTRFGEQFGGANTTLIEIKNNNGDIYDREFLEKYKAIAEEVYYHKGTHRHLSQSLILRKTKAISGSGGSVQIKAILWPELPRNDAEMQEFRTAVNNQYRGFLVSNDESSAMIIADFKEDAGFESVLDFFQDLRNQYSDSNISINVVGRPILLGYIYQSLDSVVGILVASLFLIMAILYLYFRTWIGVAVPVFTASVASIWGLGAMGAVGYNLDPLLVLLPAFIFAIVLSHGVQLTSRILRHLAENESSDCRDASQSALGKLLVPSTAAIITDASGFAVLGLVAIPSIESLALICGVWLLSVAPALIFAAAMVCLLKPPANHRHESVLLNKVWRKVVSFEHHKWLVVSVTLIIMIFGVYYAQNLKIGDTKGSAILWPDSRYNLDIESINSGYFFLGTDMMQVYIEGAEETMLQPGVYQQTEAMDRYMYEHMNEVRPAQSLVPVIKLINSVLYEGDPSYEIIPDTVEEVGFNIYLFRSRGEPGDFAAYTNTEWEIGNVSFYLEDHSVTTIQKLRENLDGFFEEQKQEHKSDADFLYIGGQVGITEALNDEIERSNLQTLISISIVIFLCIVLYYRSISVGIILLMSLATANFLTYAFMAWKEVGLNISTLPLAALGVGLGVDYGIYILDRIREEVRSGAESMFQAIENALCTSGNAIVLTAMTMIAPLIPWAVASPLRFQSEMGMLLGVVLFMNMIGSLLFVPAALAALHPKAIFGKLKEDL